MITEYLNNFLNDFKNNYTQFNKIKTSVGLTQTLENRKNFADLPLILIEDINFSGDTELLTTTGTLSFDVIYFDIDKNNNGYIKIEEDFLNYFIEYIKTINCEVIITDISFEISDTDNEFGVTVSCESVISL